MTTDVFVPLAAWPALAALAPSPTTPLSPLSTGPAHPSAGADLTSTGLVGGDGNPVASLRRPLAVLAATPAACRVQVGGSRVLELTVFAAPDGGPNVSLATEGEGLRLQDPAAVDDLMLSLEHLIGASAIVGTPLDVELTVPESLVLAALVDEQRARVLRSLVDGSVAEPVALTATAVRAAVAERAGRVFWLTGVIAERCGVGGDLSAAAVRDAVSGLVGKGLLSSGRRVALTDPTETLGTRLLVVDKVVSMLRVIARGDEIDRIGFICLQAGVHDLLMIEHVGDSVRLETVAAAGLLGYLDTFLRDPLAGASATAATAAPWEPTHTVPAGGIAAWSEPDAATPSVTLPGGTPIRVNRVWGAWAQVSVENGWSGWVDGRILGAA